MSEKKYMGESLLSSKPLRKLNIVLRDSSITNSKLSDGSVSKTKLDDELANIMTLSSLHVSGFQMVDSIESLPSEPNTVGWLVGNHLYLYVGNGEQLYMDCGELRGAKGASGASAYEIWKQESGNSNKTIQEFLDSIKGIKGDKGDKGDQGPQGLVGPQGPSGVADVSDKTLINDTTTGGATNFLSAEVGKLGIMTYDCSKGGLVAYATVQDAIYSVPQSFQKGGLTIAVVLKGTGEYLNYYLPSRDWSDKAEDWVVGSLGISQSEGTSTNTAISQKAFTDSINKLREEKVDVAALEDAISDTDDDSEEEEVKKVPTSKAVREYVTGQKDVIDSGVNEKITGIQQDVNTAKSELKEQVNMAKSSMEELVSTTKEELTSQVDTSIEGLKAEVKEKVEGLETTIGNGSEPEEGTVLKRVSDIEATIGDTETDGSIRKNIADINEILVTKADKEIIKTVINDSDDEIPTSKAVMGYVSGVKESIDTSIKEESKTLQGNIDALREEFNERINTIPKFLNMSESEYDNLEGKDSDTYYMLTEE